MRAEIAGKLSMSSPSAQDRLEDTLTDGAFSALAYLPREVLDTWLRMVLPTRFHAELTPTAVAGAKFVYWPTLPGQVEPDLVIRVGALMLVIEAKYQSGFHSIGQLHQLAAEWDSARRVCDADGLEGPVVVAITDDVALPSGVLEARAQLKASGRIPDGLAEEDLISWVSWQHLAKLVEGADTSRWLPGHFIVRDDLFSLMKRRKVRYVYEGFNKADWWLLAAAADAAAERVYPTIAEFARELTQLGRPRGLVWGGNDSGVVWYESKQVTAATDWHRNYIQLPMLHEEFGKRMQHYCSLYALFTFQRPTIRAGWWFQLPKLRLSAEQAAEIASWLIDQPASMNILANTAWQLESLPTDRDQITPSWVASVLTARGGWLRVERVWDPEQVTSTEQVIEVMQELSTSLVHDGSVLRALGDNGVLDQTHLGDDPVRIDVALEADGSAGNPDEHP